MNEFDGVRDDAYVRDLIQLLVRRPYGIEYANYLPDLLSPNPRIRGGRYGILLAQEQALAKVSKLDPNIEWTLRVGMVVYSVLDPSLREFAWQNDVLEPFRKHLASWMTGERYRDALAFFEALSPESSVRAVAIFRLTCDCKEEAGWKLTVLDRLLATLEPEKLVTGTSYTELLTYRKKLAVAAATTAGDQKKAYDDILAAAFDSVKREHTKRLPRWAVVIRTASSMSLEIVQAPTPEVAASNALGVGKATDAAVFSMDDLRHFWSALLSDASIQPYLRWDISICRNNPKIYLACHQWPSREVFQNRCVAAPNTKGAKR